MSEGPAAAPVLSVTHVPGAVTSAAVSMAEKCFNGEATRSDCLQDGQRVCTPVMCEHVIDWSTRGYLAVADASYRMLRFYAPNAGGSVGYEPLVSCRVSTKRCTATAATRIK